MTTSMHARKTLRPRYPVVQHLKKAPIHRCLFPASLAVFKPPSTPHNPLPIQRRFPHRTKQRHLRRDHFTRRLHRFNKEGIRLVTPKLQFLLQRHEERLLHITGDIDFTDAITDRFRDLAVFVARTAMQYMWNIN